MTNLEMNQLCKAPLCRALSLLIINWWDNIHIQSVMAKYRRLVEGIVLCNLMINPLAVLIVSLKNKMINYQALVARIMRPSLKMLMIKWKQTKIKTKSSQLSPTTK